MRIKSLSIVASFLVFSVAITSCLDSDNEYELSSDNIITAFSLDTIYGKTYKFTIDQINGLIYNVDSVPHSADTIINKILIKTFTTNGYVTAGPDISEPYSQDTLFNYTDSIDFIEHNPLVLRVRSADGLHTKQYKIEVRIHETDPDTLVWGDKPFVENVSGGTFATATETKAVLLDDDLFVYALVGTEVKVYQRTSTNEFKPATPVSIPTGFKVSSIVTFMEGSLFGVDEDGEVYRAIDGVNWSKMENANGATVTVVNLITTFDETIAGIIRNIDNTADIFAVATINEENKLEWTTEGVVVPDEADGRFPRNFVATKSFKTPTGGQQALLIGKPEEDDPKATYPWFTNDGYNWGQMTPTKDKYALPVMDEPSILYYGNTIYAFGKTEADGLSYIYTSVNGIVWEKIEKKFMLPLNSDQESVFKERSGYTMIVDQDNYIWMFWNQEDEAWRGKLNRLGFIIQD